MEKSVVTETKFVAATEFTFSSLHIFHFSAFTIRDVVFLADLVVAFTASFTCDDLVVVKGVTGCFWVLAHVM